MAVGNWLRVRVVLRVTDGEAVAVTEADAEALGDVVPDGEHDADPLGVMDAVGVGAALAEPVCVEDAEADLVRLRVCV